MLHILLIILKIIGILLLSILGLLLVCLLAILFVPVRYRADGRFRSIKDVVFHTNIHWFLHIVSVRILYEKGFQFKIKLFGFNLNKNKDIPEDDATEYEDEPEETMADAETLMRIAEETSEKTDMALEKAEETAELLEELIKRRSQLSEDDDTDYSDMDVSKDYSSDSDSKKHGEEKSIKNADKRRFSIKNKFTSLCSAVRARIKNAISALRRMILGIPVQVKKLENKRLIVLNFLQNEENRCSIKLVKVQLKRLLKHILPQKISGNITFGVEDPYLMGHILSAAAFFYPLYGQHLMMTPLMNTDALDGECTFKGRIRVGVVLFIALRIWMNKNIRTQFHNYRNRGGR